MKIRIARYVISTLVLLAGLAGYSSNSYAAVSVTPRIELDASNPSSLATSGATTWKDVISGGTLAATFWGNAAYSSDSGGVLTVTGAGNGGVAFPAAAQGTPTNPNTDMSLMMWVKFTSWSSDWNILASHWFTNSGGSGSTDWHFAVRNSGASPRLNLYTTNLADSYGTTALTLNKWYQVGYTLTWAGALQFYVNGVADGPLITGATRNANTSDQLWVGDIRTCGLCGMNGSIAKFRMWNSKLDSATVLNDFNSERGSYGYTPLVNSASFTLASNSPTFRVLNTITATVPLNSKVTFYENRRVIPGCKGIWAVSTTAVCKWKPSSRGQIDVRVSYTVSGSPTVNWSPTTSVMGGNRSGSR